MSKLLEITYRDPDGQECLFMTSRQWMYNSVKDQAEAIALGDYGGYAALREEDAWPRSYHIYFKDSWVQVSVEIMMTPRFSAEVV